ncbi:MAG: hypothetical protein GY953_25680, partial [bacterium]|nr:hypothetical protein [bacterium]
YAMTPRRILVDPADSALRIERLEYQTPAFLERMHRRRGYRAGLGLENAWAFSVDFVIVAMVFWVASGLWMWWGLRATRRWGTICAVAGLATFALFLITI